MATYRHIFVLKLLIIDVFFSKDYVLKNSLLILSVSVFCLPISISFDLFFFICFFFFFFSWIIIPDLYIFSFFFYRNLSIPKTIYLKQNTCNLFLWFIFAFFDFKCFFRLSFFFLSTFLHYNKQSVFDV